LGAGGGGGGGLSEAIATVSEVDGAIEAMEALRLRLRW
jgi:hypothetical protein